MERKKKDFSSLTLSEYHRLMTLRVAVFVVEQNCPYQEIDEIDPTAVHFWLEEDEKILAYARIYQTNDLIHFGRVLVAPEARRQKLGTRLVQEVVDWIEEEYPGQTIEIGAQAHLQNFYGQFGFQTCSEEYLEDDIPHIDMKKESSSPKQ
ncbi:GNAT family N-acetyltransferase [Enterococcus olivae]